MLAQDSFTGSGCIIAGNRILTNAHVVSNQTFIQVRRAGMADKYVADVAAVSHEFDLALLSVADDAFFANAHPPTLGELPSVGDAVVALGFPTGGTRITMTKGVVSRIDRSSYWHSDFENLMCQIDAAINPGSSGGPVCRSGAIVGVVFQAASGQNIGYMVPAPVIRHFLKDLGDGNHDGGPALPLQWQVLENPQIRRHYRMAKGASGVLLTKVAPLFAGDDKLRGRDVLLGVDGFDIGNDGTIEFRPGERVDFRHAIDRKQVGECLELRILRDGKLREVELALSVATRDYGYLVPRLQYEKQPSYFVLGGLVFSPLMSNYYGAWDEMEDVPIALQRYYREMRTAANAERKEVVVLIDVLPDELNAGYADFEDSVVSEVNGRPVGGLRGLIEAIETHEGESHRILLEDSHAEIVLRHEDLKRRGKLILEKYGVPADRSPDLGRKESPAK
jgi:S1-C subfamily serine protease